VSLKRTRRREIEEVNGTRGCPEPRSFALIGHGFVTRKLCLRTFYNV
jgi:hypothetical protein